MKLCTTCAFAKTRKAPGLMMCKDPRGRILFVKTSRWKTRARIFPTYHYKGEPTGFAYTRANLRPQKAGR